jgi:hypothetical protein
LFRTGLLQDFLEPATSHFAKLKIFSFSGSHFMAKQYPASIIENIYVYFDDFFLVLGLDEKDLIQEDATSSIVKSLAQWKPLSISCLEKWAFSNSDRKTISSLVCCRQVGSESADVKILPAL